MGVLFPSYIWNANAVVNGINHFVAYCVTKFTYDQWSMNSVDIDYYPCAVPLASLIRCDQLYTCPFLPLYLHFDCLVFRLNPLFIVSWLYKRSLFIFAICPNTWSVGLCGICPPSLIIIIIICFCSSKKLNEFSVLVLLCFRGFLFEKTLLPHFLFILKRRLKFHFNSSMHCIAFYDSGIVFCEDISFVFIHYLHLINILPSGIQFTYTELICFFFYSSSWWYSKLLTSLLFHRPAAIAGPAAQIECLVDVCGGWPDYTLPPDEESSVPVVCRHTEFI